MAWHFVDKPKSGTETALDACDYFVDEVVELGRCLDAREQVRMMKHRELRQAVVCGDERTVRVLLEALGSERQVIANMAPAGANTLLFLAVQAKYEGITNRLLDAGADGRSHAVTKYSPLYAAVHHGHYNIAKMLLEKFPELIQQPTVEHWLPIHAACINGHINLLELLINYKYPDYLYSTYREENGEWEWRLPFDPNAQDVTGQTSLYIASILGNKSLVNVLLKWHVKSNKTLGIGSGGRGSAIGDAVGEEVIHGNRSSCSTPITPTRKRISFGIQAIMSKLHISSEGENSVKILSKYYTKEDTVCYCKDIAGIFKQFGEPYDSKEWRLFIDGNKLSLKAVLLHIGNQKPSIPIAHALNTKETYEIMQKLLKLIKYEEHDWKICADLKVVGMLCGLQSGYTKYCCFLCKWDSRARQDHYIIKDWPERVEFQVGVDNIKYSPLIKKEKLILPPLHIKLGLIKNFVKALDKEGEAFHHLKTIFPEISEAKIKEGIFVGPQIRKMMTNNHFKELLSPVEAAAWDSFEKVVTSFLGKHKSPNYEMIVNDLIKNYAEMGVNTLLDSIMTFIQLCNVAFENVIENRDEADECEKCPVNLNLLCGAARETALLAAVRGGFVDVASLLLQHGADPNVIAKPTEDHNDPKCIEEIYGLSNVPIAEACKQRSLPILELLLKYGARDDNGSALSVAVSSNDEAMLNRLLAKRVHPDSDYKINKKCLPTPVEINVFSPSVNNISYSEMFPNVPTIIDWHNNTSVQLSFVRIDWMINGVLQLNPKLQRHPMVNEVALTAITRIDLSHNNLTTLPSEIFKLVSLKYLNIAQNKITSLPAPSQTSTCGKWAYNCPVLEELFMQDNRLISIPVEIFHLTSLTILDISNNKLQELPFDMWKTPKLRELNIAFNLLKDLPVPPMQTSASQLSLDKLELETFSASDFTETRNIKPRNSSFHQLVHRNVWSNSLEIIDNDVKWNRSKKEEGVSSINSLNIANNLFTSIPAALPCLAVNLTRLNMSYNSLRSMGHVTSYPATLKQLDLSHNEISCWPSLPRITTDFDPHLLCYSFVDNIHNDTAEEALSFAKPVVSSRATSFRSTVLKTVCRHRRHLRLESLRTLILADNLFTRIQLSTDDVATLFNESDDADWSVVGVTKSKLIFPNLSMLDISNNCLKEIPTSLHELSSLSVLNISGNVNITDLPPHLGLLSRLWNLNTRGCLLQEPLKSMIESKKYKTMDIIGYLKSIYENSVTYARMKLMVVGVQGIGKTTLLDLLRQGGGSQKTRASENNWAKRMGHVRNTSKGNRVGNISTVGVDIGTWICEKRKKAPGSYGPVTFRTWDFGGQTEYYATHQYFLSKRSLYLVLWKITDGHKGLVEVLQWLGNIQARAPNSAVIIVGTHFDAVGETISAQHAEELQQIIREKFIAIPDAEKIGLPRVIDSIEISCRTMHNIRLLANIIYDTAFMLRSPGSKEPLLLQKVPASYIALEDIVNVIACNLRSAGVDPVLNADEYRKLVTEEMRLHNYKNFRDVAELNQATMFLHDNGVILHYDDATLRDYYFLDPQWLCDMLAHVVTVREINPFARNGIMKMDDLGLLFRSTEGQSNGNRSYIVSLLNKFEVALTWDSRTLLIPSLLPHDDNATPNAGTTVEVFQRSRARNLNYGAPNEINMDNVTFKQLKSATNEENVFDVGLRRILLMTYFPSGFWSRILTRLLADDQMTEAIKSIYIPESHKSLEFDLRISLEKGTKWNLWQTGVSLYFGTILLFKIWEVPFQANTATQPFRNATNRFKLKLDGLWSDINLSSSSILEIYFPLISITAHRQRSNGDSEIIARIEPNLSAISKLLALAVDHIDLLLEDWYPALGTRFVHTSEGRFLITRLVLCPKCLQKLSLTNCGGTKYFASDDNNACGGVNKNKTDNRSTTKFWDVYDEGTNNLFSAYINLTVRRERRSEDSLCLSDADSGVGPDSTNSSRNTSVDGHPTYNQLELLSICYCWMVEECILSVYNQTKIICPVHLEIPMAKLAPDVVFSDIPDQYSISSDDIVKGSLLGRGAFGFVFKATCKVKFTRNFKAVAMKMLQPVPPGPRAKDSALMAYKMALGKWDRDPLQHACKAYCTARQELAVLLTLKHPNIVPLVGICIKPLALVLELAPMGGLDSILRQFRRSGAHIGPHTFQTLVLQAARAIEYLHRRRIIYRDLKSENVLVWDFPQPHSEDTPQNCVHIKIADYGISRQTAPSGSKGFGGTEGFMAPEIIRYNGEEEYTEKVDCFSFGMFIYENITLRQPFEGHESIKECILDGSRPPLTQRETQFPTYCLDLMVLCWDELPKKRPSASQIVSILTAPECIHLLDAIVIPHSEKIVCGAFNVLATTEDGAAGLELWLPAYNSRIDVLDVIPSGNFLQGNSIKCTNHLQMDNSPRSDTNDERSGSRSRSRSASRHCKINMLCCCIIEDCIWIGDAAGNLHSYNTNNCARIFSYMLDPAIKSPVISLVYLRNIERVAVGLHNGRVFLVDSTKVPTNCAFAEGSFVLTEICSGLILHSACSVMGDNKYELWCGEMAGKINVFPLSKTGVSGHQALCHSEEPNIIEDVKVARLCSTDNFVFSCLYPGFVVYQWSVRSKNIENKLDCSKLLPCSESLKSIAIDEHLSLIKCQISALASHGNELYIGTTWGCLIIAELSTLRPITVFRPYENEVAYINKTRLFPLRRFPKLSCSVIYFMVFFLHLFGQSLFYLGFQKINSL